MAKVNVSLNVAKIYAAEIRKGKKTIDDVPKSYKTYVRLYLEEGR